MMQQFTFVNFQELIPAYSLEIYDNTARMWTTEFLHRHKCSQWKKGPKGSYLLYIGDETLPNYMGILS